MAGMSDMIVPIIVLCVCLVSCAVSSMAMGPLRSMFSGASSLLGGAGDLVGGAASGTGKGLSAVGSVISGEIFKGPSLEKVGDFKAGVCRDCAAKNWTGSVTAFKKPVECSEAKSIC